MKRFFQTASPLFIGLFVAQAIATLQVYFSNADLHRTLRILKQAGYLIVPNQHILPRLLNFQAALWGGLFFTLTIGVFLTFFSWSAAWAWQRLFRGNRLFLFFCLLAWLTGLSLINGKGFCPLITLYFLFIPAAVFLAAAKLRAHSNSTSSPEKWLLLVPLLLLTLLWGTQAKSAFFLNLRDKILLSNSLGTKVSEFYYEYAYYPAEAFKSLDQKLLRPCSIESLQRKAAELALERTLLDYDYLPVRESRARLDLMVSEEGGVLLFQHRGKTILKTSLQEFTANPGKVLSEFSRAADPCSPFRSITLFSLLVSVPLVLYGTGFGLFYLVLSFVLSPKISAWVASILCLSLGAALFFYVHGGVKEESIDPATALASDKWETRVAALKFIEQKKLDVGDFEAYQKLLTSPHIAERYWLARALGVSRRASTFRDLFGFLDDPNTAVVSMAFYSLGQRKDSRAVPEILKRIEPSEEWYNQYYAYKALRNLGWKQGRSR